MMMVHIYSILCRRHRSSQVGEQTTTWTKRSEVENKRSGIKIVQVLSPGKKGKKEKSRARKERKRVVFSLLYTSVENNNPGSLPDV